MTDYERGFSDGVTHAVSLRTDDIMREVLDLRREVEELRKSEPCAVCQMRPRLASTLVCEVCR